MAWFKVDDKLHSHPKWLALPKGARALWVTAGSWSADQLLDGFVPTHALRTLNASRTDADALVRVGLWVESQKDGGGWQFHDWSVYQPTRKAVQDKRKATTERVQKWREKRAEMEGETHV